MELVKTFFVTALLVAPALAQSGSTDFLKHVKPLIGTVNGGMYLR
jgi:hypothetical protein